MDMILEDVEVVVKNPLVIIRAEIRRLEGERVFVWERWIAAMMFLALYNARCAWGDVIRRMNTARRNAISERWN